MRALKQQFARNFDPLKLPSIVSAITSNVEVGGKVDDRTVLRYALFAATLQGGHFFQDKIQGVTGYGESHAPDVLDPAGGPASSRTPTCSSRRWRTPPPSAPS